MLSWKFDAGTGGAKNYVGTDEVSGQLQFDLLRKEGCTPAARVLEVGCGCLHASIPLIRFLDTGNFAGIDPNEWLRRAAMKEADVKRLVRDKQPRFLTVKNFDASSLGMSFDYILSHSILSHAAHWQLDEFLKNTSKVLSPGGRIVASIRLAEGNDFGSPGSVDGNDSMDEEWVYPGISWFTLPTIREAADKFGLRAQYLPEYTAFYTRTRPNEFHDWFVFSRK